MFTRRWSPAGATPEAIAARLTLLAVLLVIARSAIWVFWEQAHFDSDQAVFGLMAKHVAEGRAFPVFMYGQNYNLAMEAWVAAPVIALAGAQVWALKLPLLLANIAIAVLLIRLLQTEAGLAASAAFTAALWFVLPPPIASSRLVEVSGGNIEPLLYALLIWMTRRSAIACGIVGGVGVANRELAVFAVMALVAVEALGGELRRWPRLRARLLSLVIMALVVAGAKTLGPYGSSMGPGTAGMRSPLPLAVSGAPPLVEPAKITANIRWLFSENLATLFGWRANQLADYGVTSRLTVGHWWTGLALAALVAAACWSALAGAVRRLRSHSGSPPSVFPWYLIITGILVIAAYASTRSAQDRALVRYTLAALLTLTGAAALALQHLSSHSFRRAVIASIAIWAAGSALDTARLWNEYLLHTPSNRPRRLIAYLDEHQVRFGRASYWTAYLVDFISSERIIVASSDFVRVQAYQQAVDATPERRAIITNGPCNGGHGTFLQYWCVDVTGPR